MRTLLIRPGAIGDCIRSFPELEEHKSAYTEVWISRPVVPLVCFAGRVRAIADMQLDMVGLPGIDAPASTIQSLLSFDRVHSWYGSNRPEFRHAVSYLPFQFHQALPDRRPPGIPRIPISGPWHGSIIFHPFSSSPKKNWPIEEFDKLAAAFGGVEWTCGPEEEVPGCAARRFEDLGEMAVWLSGARLFVGNDSGITHLAAAVGTPTLAMFGPTDPSLWCPAGPNVRWLPFQGHHSVSEALRAWAWV